MKDYQVFDIFKDKLPEITFDKELSEPVHKERCANWNKRSAEAGEVFIEKIVFGNRFPDPCRLLETAYEDFMEFMKFSDISYEDGGFTLSVEVSQTACFEAYKINVTPSSITIYAADTEAVRRALIYLEDEMKRRSGAFLPLGEIERKPFIKNRISRCYFTPSNHSAIEEKENELCDDRDYYPDEYLNRLAHDGINALWLGASLRYLVKTDLVPEYGTDADKRVKKLNAVIAKCKRYGIKTFLFAVDPASSYNNPHLVKHPDMIDDNEGAWIRHLCPSTDAGIKYLTEAVKSLFKNSPDLAGYINLSVGESQSTCASIDVLRCNRCKAKFGTIGKTLAFVEKTIADAIHEVSPNAEYISWTYAQRGWQQKDIDDACIHRDKEVIHLQNFEDFGRPVQLGKKRLALDYWLSFAGPGQLFEDTMAINRERGIRTYAKIQVCSSHEISTVPYVTAPGIIYDKYKYFYDHGVEGVMQCWFFGNYPCLMNKAAGELSFMPFPETKEEFLKKLAGIYWGADADKVVKAWTLFENAYVNFPVSVSFEWLGPMQDSPAVPLHLIPVDRSMPSTWLAVDAVGGDRIGECMLNGHTHAEAMELVRRMQMLWNEGNSILEKISDCKTKERAEQKNVAEATDLIFKSGYNVIRFYYLRHLLGTEAADATETLAEMRKIVNEEMEISKKLIPICAIDNRIGYHSEAHGHKIFPKKLEWRISCLEELLKTEFEEVEERIAKGLPPLKFYLGDEEGTIKYQIGRDEKLAFETIDGSPSLTELEIKECDTGYNVLITARDLGDDTVCIYPEFRMFHPTIPLVLTKSSLKLRNEGSFSIYKDDVEKKISEFDYSSTKIGDNDYLLRIFIDRSIHDMPKGEVFRLDIRRCPAGKFEFANAKEALHFSDKTYTRLIHGSISPESYCFIIPKK